MDLGLENTRKELFSKQGEMRRNMPDVLLAVTDGKSDKGGKLFMSIGLDISTLNSILNKISSDAAFAISSLIICIVCTGSEMKTRQQSKQLKDDEVVIFALGIGSNVDEAELNALASEENGVFRFASVREMSPKENALKIALALCSGTQQVVNFQTNRLPSLALYVTPRHRLYGKLCCTQIAR